jgi:hypothetical protein
MESSGGKEGFAVVPRLAAACGDSEGMAFMPARIITQHAAPVRTRRTGLFWVKVFIAQGPSMIVVRRNRHCPSAAPRSKSI